MQRKLDFFFIGAMKSGPSSLRASLTSHPDISVLPAEQSFNSPFFEYLQGLDWFPALADTAAKRLAEMQRAK